MMLTGDRYSLFASHILSLTSRLFIEDATFEVCLGLQTLLELKVSPAFIKPYLQSLEWHDF